MRLQAYLARAGAAPSRRKAEALISAGRVKLNGETATLGASVSPQDEVSFEGESVTLPQEPTYLALNKPAGYLTTLQDEPGLGRPTVSDLMPEVPGLVPVGRLDADTTGLLILTNDGPLAHHIAHPSSEIEKQYRLTIRGRALESSLAALTNGPTLEDGKMLPPKLTNLNRTAKTTTFNMTIHEGRKRIIRRACKAVGLSLIYLERIRVGPVFLGDLSPGRVRDLTQEELKALR